MQKNSRVLLVGILMVASAGLAASCGGGGSSPDADAPGGQDGGGSSADAGSSGKACVDAGMSAALCTTLPPAVGVTDLSGTWVLETIGAQVVKAPGFAQPFHIKSISTALLQVSQIGSAVTFAGQYCNRIQQDDPKNPAQVIVLDAWGTTSTPVQRTGSFVADASGRWTLSMPAVVEVFGAQLANPGCDPLPIDPSDVRLSDDDHDGSPGISLGLLGVVNGTLRAVQRQVTSMSGLATSADRVEGGMAYVSDQTVVASDPGTIKDLYKMSSSYADPGECSSSFVMVRVSPSAGAVDCTWVRNNQTALGLLGVSPNSSRR